MLFCIIGRSGHGKTEYLMNTISERCDSRSFVIVPEQQSVEMEEMLSIKVGDSYNMYCEVLNFDRLPERIFRDIGGVKERYLDKAGKDIITSGVLSELSDSLLQYKNTHRSSDHIQKIQSELEQLKRYLVTPEQLSEMSKITESLDIKLSTKLSDLSLILAKYNECFKTGVDPTDSMRRLVEKLDGINYFDGMNVYIDGYYSYTAGEMAVLAEILKSAKNVYMTFLLGDGEMFSESERTYRSVLKLASLLRVKHEDINLFENTHHKTPQMVHLEENMWNYGAKRIPSDGNVVILKADDVFSESSYVASYIKKLVREGYRYRDIGIAMRSTSEYEGILDVVLKKYDIPCFMSVKQELSSKSIVSLMLSLCELASTDLSLQSVKNYIKSSYCDLSFEERDRLDSYITMWDIRGESTYKKQWRLNPKGYSSKFEKSDIAELKLVNHTKDKFIASIEKTIKTLKSRSLTYAIGAKAVYDHLVSIGADSKLLEKAKLHRKLGEEDKATGLVGVWSIVVRLLDEIYEIGGDRQVNARTFFETLKMVVDEYELGNIPTSNDEVTVGEAQLIRFSDKKILFIMGVNEGVFPSNSKGDDLFGEKERRILEGYDFGGVASRIRMQKREQFLFYRTAVSPSHKLLLSYPCTASDGQGRSPSVAVLSISKLFEDAEIQTPDATFLIETATTALENYSSITEEAKAFLEEEGFSLSPSLSQTQEKINLSLNNLKLSPSSIERYGLCPFSFFGKYLLRLRETRKASFDVSETGTFIHKLLEQFVSEHKDDIRDVSDELIEESVNRISKDFLTSFVPDEKLNARFAHRLRRLESTAVEVIKNIRDEFIAGDFSPFEVEHRINATIELDGDVTNLSGVIDRVDMLERDGKKYVRIVDYKTGTKKLKLDDVLDGLSLQMLLYLFYYCKETDSVACGAMYMHAAKPDEDDNKNTSSRSGIFIDDKEILLNMEHGLAGKFLPVKLKKDGSFFKNPPVLTKDEFELLEKYIYDYIKGTAASIKNGDLLVRPIINKNVNACKHCKLRPLCRMTEQQTVDAPILDENLRERASAFGKENKADVDRIPENRHQ